MVGDRLEPETDPCRATRQRVAVEALARGVPLAGAAKHAKTSIRTLFEWRQREDFQAAIREAQDRLFADARGQLRAACGDAVRTLREILNDVDAAPSARVRAALGVLEHVHRTQGVEELQERIARLEKSLATRSSEEPRRWAS